MPAASSWHRGAAIRSSLALSALVHASLALLFFPEFYWCLYNSGDNNKLLGHDSTISVPSEAEKKKIHAILQTLPRYASMEFADATEQSRWVEVEIDGKRKRCFTVGAPIFQSKGLFGGGTRVDRVLIEDEEPSKMHVLKDSWRYVDEKLDGKMSKGLGTRLGGMDLTNTHAGHKTITAQLRNDGHALLDRCFPLEEFQSTKQLAKAVRGAVHGHQTVFEAGVLHRDDSVGNILIDENGHGFLHDWDNGEFTEEGLKRFKLLHPTVYGTEPQLNDMTHEDVSYASVLNAFDVALASPGWPENDSALLSKAVISLRATGPLGFRKSIIGLDPDLLVHALVVGPPTQLLALESGGSVGSGHKRKRDADDDGSVCNEDGEDGGADDEEDVVGDCLVTSPSRPGESESGSPKSLMSSATPSKRRR
ncbi:hypothetical protein B0H10DRAFT_2430211 [Mycena sp. CBHHK59/15]|nr:hypothetical protein B0H10DRAFT_2430211 [Mycena sp. CBHHK59/15]